ncbi:MAG: hydrogenase [Firmicutes bacterium]|nr:hydrogenase [Bacillota bacterium]
MMNRIYIDENNLSIDRIEHRCINCGMCKKTCESINGFKDACINCGQCILTCPTGALIPKYNYRTVMNYLKDTNLHVVVLTSPAVRVAIGDEFGFEPGAFLEGKMVGALFEMGFDKVFDTTFGADLTVVEEAKELINRLATKQNLPMFTSCCPSWVSYVKQFHPEDLRLLSSCKSPISMQGEMIKSYYANFNEIDANNIITVALTPCVSKKTEVAKYKKVDFVITTSELAMMIREFGLDFQNIKEKEYSKILGKGSGAGLIFGSSGGVMEATLRTAYYFLNEKNPPQNFFKMANIRGNEEFKEIEVDLGQQRIKIAVINKMATVEAYYERLKNYDFIEVMACPNGCIGGGGQPLMPSAKMDKIREARMNSLYQDDANNQIQSSYLNNEIKEAYETFINKGKVSLHTKH